MRALLHPSTNSNPKEYGKTILEPYFRLAIAVAKQAREDINSARELLERGLPVENCDPILNHARIAWRWMTDRTWHSRLPFDLACDGCGLDREIAANAARANVPDWLVRRLEEPVEWPTVGGRKPKQE